MECVTRGKCSISELTAESIAWILRKVFYSGVNSRKCSAGTNESELKRRLQQKVQPETRGKCARQRKMR